MARLLSFECLMFAKSRVQSWALTLLRTCDNAQSLKDFYPTHRIDVGCVP